MSMSSDFSIATRIVANANVEGSVARKDSRETKSSMIERDSRSTDFRVFFETNGLSTDLYCWKKHAIVGGWSLH